MGSGSGHGELTSMESIHEFVAAAVQAILSEQVRIKELTRTKDTGIEDHSFSVPIGYSFRFRGMPVTIRLDEIDLSIDGVRVGRDVDPLLYRRLKDACAERFVFQLSEDAAALREAVEGCQRDARQEKYGALVQRLRKAKAAHRSKPPRSPKPKKKK